VPPPQQPMDFNIGGVFITVKALAGTPSPLWWAAKAVRDGEEGALELATLLLKNLKNEGDVNDVGKDEDGFEGTPLWMAAIAACRGWAGGFELVKLLIKKGADINAVGTGDGVECTTLWMAAYAVHEEWAGGLELAMMLLELCVDADVNAFGTDGDGQRFTPLLLASRAVCKGKAGALGLAKLLVQKGANVNVNIVGSVEDGEHYCGDTPLLLAAQAVYYEEADGIELVKLLLEKGADVTAYQNFGNHKFRDGIEGNAMLWAAKAVLGGIAEDGWQLATLLGKRATVGRCRLTLL